MAGRVRDILVRFLGDEKDLVKSQRVVQQELDKTTKKTGLLGQNTEAVGKKFKAFAAGAILALGAGLASLVGKLDQLGQKMQATERMAETVFGSMVDEAREWADENNEAFGIGESALLSLLSKTQDLLVPMGFARQEAFALSKEILNTANALSEWEGGTISATDAQLRIAKAMLGEREGLVELGVKLSDAEVKARLAAKGLRGLTGEALIQATALVTLEAITEKSTDALTAYETRAGSATAAQKELAASTEDTAEAWADILRPVIDDAKTSMADLTDILQFASEKTAELEGATEDSGHALFDWVSRALLATDGLSDLIDVVGWLADKTREASVATYDHGAAQDADRQEAIGLREALATTGNSAATMGTKFETAAGQVRDLANAQKELLSPAFAHIQAVNRNEEANERLAAAEEALKEAIREHGRSSEEAVEAQDDLDSANQDVATSFIDMRAAAENLSNVIDSTLVKSLEDTLRLAGLSEAAIRRLLTMTLSGGGPIVEIRDPNLARQGPAVDTQGGFIPRSAVTPASSTTNYNINVTSGPAGTPTQARQVGTEIARTVDLINRERSQDMN